MLFSRKTFLSVFGIVALAAAAMELFIGNEKGVPGLSIVLGAAGCCFLVFVGNFVLRPLLQRAEDYYGGGEDDE